MNYHERWWLVYRVEYYVCYVGVNWPSISVYYVHYLEGPLIYQKNVKVYCIHSVLTCESSAYCNCICLRPVRVPPLCSMLPLWVNRSRCPGTRSGRTLWVGRGYECAQEWGGSATGAWGCIELEPELPILKTRHYFTIAVNKRRTLWVWWCEFVLAVVEWLWYKNLGLQKEGKLRPVCHPHV